MTQVMRAMTAGALTAALALWVPLVGASHDPDVDDNELRCQQNAAKAVTKFTKAKAQCINSCWTALRHGAPRDCQDTSQDGDPRDTETQSCVQRAEDKALDRYSRTCNGPACPECYSNGDCPADGLDKVATAEAVFDVCDAFLAHCDDSGSVDGLTEPEAKCQDVVAANLSRLPAALAQCTSKCVGASHRGEPRDCDPYAEADANLDACLDAAEAACAARIDRDCVDAPECLGGAPVGNDLCRFVRSITDAQYSEYYCGE